MRQTPEHLPFLDYLRGIAIILVFLFHSIGATFSPTFHHDTLPWHGLVRDFNAPLSFLCLLPASFGWAGVPIFFVISGFCIHLSHARSQEKGFHIFFLRRFFRIYPPYLVALFFFALIYSSTRLHFGFKIHDPHDVWSDIGQLGSHLFLVHNLFQEYHHGINGSFWSIGAEVQLYLLYPLLLWLVTRWGWCRALWLIALIEVGMRSLQGTWTMVNPSLTFPYWYTSFPLIYWFSWSMGAAAADAYLKGEPLPFRTISLRTVLILFMGCYIYAPIHPYTFTLVALMTVIVIVRLLNRPTAFFPLQGWRGMACNHLRWAGIVSYSAYLIHQPIVNRVPKWTADLFHNHHLPDLVVYVFCLLSWPFIFGIAYLFYRYIELPSIAWGKRVIQKKRSRENPSPYPNQPIAEISA